MLHLGGTVSADNKAAGKQCIARPFYNGVGFTRKQGLVDLAFPCYHNGVGTNLVAGGQQQNVIRTICSTRTCRCWPPRTTPAFGAEIRESLSMVRLARMPGRSQ